MEFVGTKQASGMAFSVHQLELRRRYIHSLKNGTPLSEKIEPIKQAKTHQQVKTIFGLAIMKILDEFERRGIGTDELLNLDEPTGEPVSKGMLKEYLYAVCPIYNEDGKRITLSHKDCTKECASNFIKSIQHWAQRRYEIFIPDPNPELKDRQRLTDEPLLG